MPPILPILLSPIWGRRPPSRLASPHLGVGQRAPVANHARMRKSLLLYAAVASALACWSGVAFGQSLEEWDRRLRRNPPPSVRSDPPVAPNRAAPPKTVLYEERGGRIADHWERWKALAAEGGEVEIRGPCWSACTLILAHIPRERLCFDKHAELNFHQAARPNGEPVMEATRWMVAQYPKDIREWINTMGGVETLPTPSPNHPAGTFYMLFPVQLWAMGYRKCGD
jgi:hypothetical protein